MPQPTRSQLRRFRTDRQKLVKARQEVGELETRLNEQEDALLDWLEEMGVDSATIHDCQIEVTPVPACVDWQRAFREACGDEAADRLIDWIERKARSASVVVLHEKQPQPRPQ